MAKMREGLSYSKTSLATSLENLRRAHRAGVPLVTGTDAGNMPLMHGPAVHREMQLWVKAGVPAAVALQAATGNAARLLGIAGRTGTIEKGKEATLLVLDANPLDDIAATERVSTILFKGERIVKAELLTQE
jgi:imidazolonepropionase-like amidohydrolase